jgi:hypothetical protein
VLHRARAAVQSKSGKALLRRRGEHLERGFCHVLDHGGRRRATLSGCEKLTKAYSGAVLGHNLSVLMRHLHGCGTPKQWVAVFFLAFRRWLPRVIGALAHSQHLDRADTAPRLPWSLTGAFLPARCQSLCFSTGC